MKCLNEGQLQAYLDDELNDIEKQQVETHLFQCEKCIQVYKDISSVNNFVSEKISDYGEIDNKRFVEKQNIYSEELRNKKGVFNVMKKYKKVVAAACAVVVLSTCITVKPIRAAISDAVSIFRATDMKSVNVSYQDIKKLEQGIRDHKTDIDIEKIGKFKYVGGEHSNISIEDAKKKVSFALNLPKNLQENNIKNLGLIEESKLDFTIDVDNVNQIIKSLGGKKLFPKELDGKTFSIKFPQLVDIEYNTKEKNKDIYMMQGKLPEIIAPAGVDVDEIFDAVTELSILPSELQEKLKSMKDWKSTLYLPNVEGELEELNINGIKAFGHFESDKNNKYSRVIFLKDGVINSINGSIDKDEIIEIVKSMR